MQDLAESAADAALVGQIRAFAGWLGQGRKLTQKGRITLADARELVALLETGDEIDPKIGDRVFKTKSSEELRGLNVVVEWAKAARLVRASGGRLVPVKKNAPLLERPVELFVALLEVFGKIGPALLPSGWAETLLRREFADVAPVMLKVLYARGSVPLGGLYELAWKMAAAPYVLDKATDQQLTHWRRANDRDVEIAMEGLERLGVVTLGERTVKPTALGRYGLGRLRGVPAPGEPVYQVKVALAEVADPPVWRRVLVPVSIGLDRLHEVIQAAMGWQDCHLHAFTVNGVVYGRPDPEFGLVQRDERTFTLGEIARVGDRIEYEYDFGDGWKHELRIEERLAAQPDRSYPACVAGGGACPPEDSGGSWGYQELKEVVGGPADEGQAHLVSWLGLERAGDFDPARFDVAAAEVRVAML
jgi:hypothetical protein